MQKEALKKTKKFHEALSLYLKKSFKKKKKTLLFKRKCCAHSIKDVYKGSQLLTDLTQYQDLHHFMYD